MCKTYTRQLTISVERPVFCFSLWDIIVSTLAAPPPFVILLLHYFEGWYCVNLYQYNVCPWSQKGFTPILCLKTLSAFGQFSGIDRCCKHVWHTQTVTFPGSASESSQSTHLQKLSHVYMYTQPCLLSGVHTVANSLKYFWQRENGEEGIAWGLML